MLPSLELYSTFADLAGYQSLSTAAKAMHISQPALSVKVAELERSLGVKLIFRTNRGFTLTGEGQALLEHLRLGFSQIEAGENRLKEIAGLESGLMRVGASDMTLRFFLLDHLEVFRREHPGVKLAVTNAPTPQTLAALKNGLIDFCVISEPIDQADTRELEFLPVRTIQDVFVCTERYTELLSGEIGIAELSQAPLVLLGRETSTRRYIDRFFAPDSLCADIELATSDLLLEFARRGIGVACIVEDFAKADLESGRLLRIHLKKELPPRSFLLAYSKKLPLPSAASQLIDQIISSLSKRAEPPQG